VAESSRSGRDAGGPEEQLPLQPEQGGTSPRPIARRRKRASRARRPARPRPPTKGSDDPGAELERRVGRAEFAEGAFVRLRALVRTDAEPGRDILTDIDVLSVDIDLRLRITRSALECKSGERQSGEPDRLLWLGGFRQYLGVDRAVLVRESATRRGVALARSMGLHVLSTSVLSGREAANAWVPERFAHVGGDACRAAEKRTDTQLRAIAELPPELIGYLRHRAVLDDSYTILGALTSLGLAIGRAAVLPEPAGLVVAGHALISLLLAAIQDAGRAEVMLDEDLRRRIELALVTGNPDDTHVLDVLTQADELLRAKGEEIHGAYVEAGAARLDIGFPSLRELVTEPPTWVDRYVDFVTRLRANPTIARDLLQTTELAVFDALVGGEAWRAAAFDHLFTQEHWGLLSSGVRLLSDVAGKVLADRLGKLKEMDFTRTAPNLPDRRQPISDSSGAAAARLAKEETKNEPSE
jgi:hypothetical protein